MVRPKPILLSGICLFLSVFALPGMGAERLDAVETSIVEWSEAHVDEFAELLERLVNINSGTNNAKGVKAVGAILQTELKTLNFQTRWVDLPEEMERGGHLFAKRSGNKGKKLLLIGHLDTVFEPDDAFQTYRREGSTAYGPGVEDMKSGDVIILYALKALQHAGVLDGTQIVVAFSGDEESPGRPLTVSRKELIDAGKWADITLGFESGIEYDGREWATISRRSSSEWCLEVVGKQAHSSGIFGDKTGAGAIFEAARILTGFYEEVRGEEYLTFNAGTIMGGTDVSGDCFGAQGSVFGKTNVVPNRAVVRGGIRTISNQQLSRAREAMRAVVARNLPVTSASITFTEGYPAMAPTDGNRHLRDMLSSINQALGRDAMPLLDASQRGAADISFVAPYSDGLAGMGGYGSGGHTPKESLDLDSVPIAIQRAAILIYRLSR